MRLKCCLSQQWLLGRFNLPQAEACLSLDIEMTDKLPTTATAAAALVPSTEPTAAALHDNPFEDALQRGWQAEGGRAHDPPQQGAAAAAASLVAQDWRCWLQLRG
jgi:hypothetical protein